MAWTGIRAHGMDNLNIFKIEEIPWNQSQGTKPKLHLFGKKDEGVKKPGKMSN